MAPVFNHEKLKAYQDAVRFCVWVDSLLARLPHRLEARDQLGRASTSIVPNIAEGNGKRSNPDRCRFFDIARGSSLECAACLDVLRAKGHITADEETEGTAVLLSVVSLVAGLVGRFSDAVEEEQAPYAAVADQDQDQDQDHD